MIENGQIMIVSFFLFQMQSNDTNFVSKMDENISKAKIERSRSSNLVDA